LAKEASNAHQSSAAAKGIKLSLELAENLPETMQTDATRLQQVLNNLLSNAVKFTSSGEVTMSVCAVDNDIAFAVRDTGPGIPPEFHSEVFEKFKQLETFLTRHHEGTGLGLALVKQLVEHMGGRITLDSEVGVGSTFTVYLPRAQTHE
jgi:signal transduction histidine kinase